MSIDTKVIEKNAGKLRSLLKKSSKLLNGKQVHRLRTRARRMEAIVDALQLSERRNERRLLHTLAGVRKRAGKVRDMDVLTEELSKVDFNGNKKSVVPLLEFLGEERRRLAKKLRRALAKDGPKIRRRLKTTSSRIVKLVEGAATEGTKTKSASRAKTAAAQKHEMTPEARAKISEAIVRMSDELAAPAALNRSNLHDYRKNVKKLRYVLQAAEEHANGTLVADLGKCKDAIGEWHDWDELVKLANEVAEDDHSVREAVKKLAAIRQEKFDSALALTNQMRTRYAQFEPGAKHRHASHRGASRHGGAHVSEGRAHSGKAHGSAGHGSDAALSSQAPNGSANDHRQHEAGLHLAESVTE